LLYWLLHIRIVLGSSTLGFRHLIGLMAFLQCGLQELQLHPAAAAKADNALAALNLDCEADPESCTAAAQLSNSYSVDDDAAGSASYDAAAAEAAAYLYASQAPSGWDVIIGNAPNLQQAASAASSTAAAAAAEAASSSYEGSEAVWEQRRIAEEAGAQYMDASELGLDCSSEQQDGLTARECERSREANRYEASGKVQVCEDGLDAWLAEIDTPASQVPAPAAA
jgi:hypothetical protein